MHIRERRRELWRHHADYGVGLTVKVDGLSQNSPVAAEGTDPNCVAEHHDTILAPLFLVGCERPTQFRLGAKDVKEIRRHGPAIHLLRFVATREVVSSAPPSRQTVKDAVLLPPVVKIGNRHGALIDPARLLRRPHIHKPTRIVVRQRAQ